MENHKNRKLNRLKGYDYSQDGWYFITICAKNREHFFGEIINAEMELSETGKIAQKCWKEIPTHFPDAELDEYVIMPNHIHGIIVIENKTAVIADVGNKLVGNNNVGNKNFCSLPICSLPIWQKSYYDHIIHNENSLNKIREYIKNNPLKWETDRNNAENLWM